MISLSKVAPARLLRSQKNRKYFGWLPKKKDIPTSVQIKKQDESKNITHCKNQNALDECKQNTHLPVVVGGEESKENSVENRLENILGTGTTDAGTKEHERIYLKPETGTDVEELKIEKIHVNPETEKVLVDPLEYVDGYFALPGMGATGLRCAREEALKQGYEMYDTYRGIVIDNVNQYYEIKDIDSISECYITTFSVKRSIAVKVVFHKKYFSKDDVDVMVRHVALVEAEI